MTTPHTAWCAGGHRCNLDEHRAHPLTLRVPGAGSLVLTRVQSNGGRGYAEIRLSISLPANEHHARQRLVSLLTHLKTLIGPARGNRTIGGAA